MAGRNNKLPTKTSILTKRPIIDWPRDMIIMQ